MTMLTNNDSKNSFRSYTMPKISLLNNCNSGFLKKTLLNTAIIASTMMLAVMPMDVLAEAQINGSDLTELSLVDEVSSDSTSSLTNMGDLNPSLLPNELSLLEAQKVLTKVSPKLAANHAAIEASKLQSQASERLNQPIVFLQTQATHYNLDTDVDLTGIKSGIDNKVNGFVDSLPFPIPNLNLPPLSSGLPDTYNLQQSGNKVGANIVAVWPVYTAGRTEAITRVLDDKTREAQADALIDSDKLYSTLVERYFTAQLAIFAAYLREDALQTTQQTDHLAMRLLEEGLIARVERLEAQVALADAKSEAIKARNKANLAITALQKLLRSPHPIKPTSPLFVSSKRLPPLEAFQQIALANHPGLKKVDAKYNQAMHVRQFSDTGIKPTVSVYGIHEIDKDPSWLVGVSANWKLWGGLDKKAQLAAGDARMNQALLTKIEVSDNIELLVEKNWKAVENARVHYLSLQGNVRLAKELLRLKQLGLVEGVNTALEVTTAQTKYLKARTEQAAAANDYVQALAALMESCGTPFAFNDYMAAADIRLPYLPLD